MATRGVPQPAFVRHTYELFASVVDLANEVRLRAVAVVAAVVARHVDVHNVAVTQLIRCLLYTSPSPRDQRGSRMPSSA